MVTLQLRQIKVEPGHQVRLEDVDWAEFEAILDELGNSRSTRISYSNRTLTIVAPLFRHEKSKLVLRDLVAVLLDELGIDYDVSGSTTFKRKDLGKGVEPDDSFYIQNMNSVLHQDRIDLNVAPPPDLAIEVDLTSKTDIEIYEALGVPELWRYDGGALRIDVLQDGKYEQVEQSPTFPDWPIAELADQYLSRSRVVGGGRAKREFRDWVREQLKTR